MRSIQPFILIIAIVALISINRNSSEKVKIRSNEFSQLIINDTAESAKPVNLNLEKKEIILESNKVEVLDKKNKGTAKISWYGDFFHGKKTANGQIYDKNEMTAAHKKLPFGTKVKITNPKNGKSVIVEINDRGPYVGKREFDLSQAAFSKIANTNRGILNIAYEII